MRGLRPLKLPESLIAAAIVCLAPLASGDVPPLYATVDSVAVRFYASDTGGLDHPKFITQRQASFEARLLALEEQDSNGSPQLRHVRTAIEAHVAEVMLASLPLDHPPDAKALAGAVALFRAALEQRVGGRGAVDKAMRAEGISKDELDAMLTRQAHAAFYLDSIAGPLLTVTEDQLREAYRATSHPFRARRFEECREDLMRWLIIERFRAAEQAYLQGARSRVTIVYSS